MRNFVPMILSSAKLVAESVVDMIPAIIALVFFVVVIRHVFQPIRRVLNVGSRWLLFIIILNCIVTASSAEDLLGLIGIITFSFSGAELGFKAFFNKKRILVIPICFVTALLCAFGGGCLIRDLLLLHKRPSIDLKGVFIAVFATILSIVFNYNKSSQESGVFFDISFDFFYVLGLTAFMISTKKAIICSNLPCLIDGGGEVFLCCNAMGWGITAVFYRFERKRVCKNIKSSLSVIKLQTALSFVEAFIETEEEQVAAVVFLDRISVIFDWGIMMQEAILSRARIRQS